MIEAAGVPLQNFEGPIQAALTKYSELTDGALSFDVEAASQLEPVEGNSYAAKSTTAVNHLGKAVELVVIAFGPGQGSGDQTLLKLKQIDRMGGYPRSAGSLPRSKQKLSHEIHLTLASAPVDEPNADPVLFAGSLDLVGIDEVNNRLVKLATLGQQHPIFSGLLLEGIQPQPTVTSTLGYPRGKRFGDPHAAVNKVRRQRTPAGELSVPSVQLAAFIGITHYDISKHYDIITRLGADIPRPESFDVLSLHDPVLRSLIRQVHQARRNEKEMRELFARTPTGVPRRHNLEQALTNRRLELRKIWDTEAQGDSRAFLTRIAA